MPDDAPRTLPLAKKRTSRKMSRVRQPVPEFFQEIVAGLESGMPIDGMPDEPLHRQDRKTVERFAAWEWLTADWQAVRIARDEDLPMPRFKPDTIVVFDEAEDSLIVNMLHYVKKDSIVCRAFFRGPEREWTTTAFVRLTHAEGAWHVLEHDGVVPRKRNETQQTELHKTARLLLAILTSFRLDIDY